MDASPLVLAEGKRMASVQDYIGKTFGEFVIEKSIGHGAEAEVLQCLQRSTGLRYILRLAVAEDALWDGPPLLPPRNASIEWANARGTWLVAPTYYGASLAKLKDDDDAWKIQVPAIYGLYQDRYLVPVASPVRVKNALNIDAFLAIAPANDIYLFGLWEAVVFALMGAADTAISAGDDPSASPLAKLMGGAILTQATAKYMGGRHLVRGRAECHPQLPCSRRRPAGAGGKSSPAHLWGDRTQPLDDR